jgi:hypothetical protein
LSFEPIRIGSTVMVLNRPRLLQLLAFLCGGYVMGMGVGLIVLFIRWRTPSTTTNITVPRVEMVIGLLGLMSPPCWPRTSPRASSNVDSWAVPVA